MSDRLAGKVAFITGAGTGIGRAGARLFAREGASVIVAEFNVDAGEETVAQIRADGGTAMFVETDVRKPDSVSAAIAASCREFGGLNVIYNNAGGSISQDGEITEVSHETFWHSIQVDLFGTWLCCQYGIPELIKSGGGAIVNTTSINALFGNPGRDAYSAAKGGVLSLTRSLAVEYASRKIRVNALAPGATMTNRVKSLMARDLIAKRTLERHLLGFPEPEHVAQAALFLASDESAMTTGHILPIDSGISIS